MLNYVKSEWFRIARGKTIYAMTAILSALTVAMNVVLFLVRQGDINFPYASITFSLNTLTNSLYGLFVMGAIVVALLFAEDRKNGTLKNSIAYGISRESIFLGKCGISLAWAVIIMIIVLVFYVGSAFLLLEGSGAEPLQKMLEGIGAAMPSALASVILAVALLSLCNNIIVSVVWWAAITFIIPKIFYQIGFAVELFSLIAKWMPVNFFNDEVIANMDGYDCLWNTSFGLMKCLVAGFGFAFTYMVIGLLGIRKKDV